MNKDSFRLIFYDENSGFFEMKFSIAPLFERKKIYYNEKQNLTSIGLQVLDRSWEYDII